MTLLYLGGETKISVLQLSGLESGQPELDLVQQIDIGPMPSFLAFSSQRRLVLALSEGGNALISLEDSSKGELSVLSQMPCPGGPAFLSLCCDEKFVLAASYGSGETRAYPLSEAGILEGEPSAVSTGQYTHSARSLTHSARGAHSIVLAPSKGEDQVSRLSLSADSGQLRLLDSEPAPVGSGPRHIVFSSSESRAFVSCENDCSVLSFDIKDDELEFKQHLSSLPRKMQKGDSGSDLHLSRDDAFLYVSNRGHDSIAVFAVEESGLRLIQHEGTRGRVPRNFCLLGSQDLIVANQESASLTFMRRDVQTGLLSYVATLPVLERVFWVGNRESY